MKTKKKVAVLMGGKTPEYEISLISGREVVANLPKKYRALPIVISRNGSKWQLIKKEVLLKALDNPLALLGTENEPEFGKKSKLVKINDMAAMVDVVFIAMHGPFGEDGIVQGALELAGIPYTGPGVLASALSMDKLRFRKIMKAEGISIPGYVSLRKNEPKTKVYKQLGKPPFFVKPNDQGSSVGMSLVRRKKDLGKAIKLAFKYSDIVLVDEYIKGLEITCAILGNNDPIPLPLVEIIPLKEDYFDYDSKYTDGGAEEIAPARIPKKLTSQVQTVAIGIYKAIGCKGFSRVDFILKDNRWPVVLEINTIPGLTPMSLLPKAAEAGGISYDVLLDKIIKYAIE